MITVDLEEVFDEVEDESERKEYRDAMRRPYGDESRNTPTQQKAWDYLQRETGNGPQIAMLGAKGSAKTHLGACFAMHQGQKFPGSLGCMITNTYGQTKTSIWPIFRKIANGLGFNVEFYDKKKIRGEPYVSVVVVDEGLPGEFFILFRSFENISTIEGVELDWLWVEECQDADKDDFIVVTSRNRGKGADNAMIVNGMPTSPFHWQYKLLPKMGMVKEGEPGYGVTGVMYWPKLTDNAQNVPVRYLERMKLSHTGDLARRYIEGLPSVVDGSLVAYNYDDNLHRVGRMSRLLCRYDRNLPAIQTVDFNARQMCSAIWQEKPWNDKWDGDEILEMDDGTIRVYDDMLNRLKVDDNHYSEYASYEDYAPANRYVLAQVDEMQIWSGGTRALMEETLKRYKAHNGGWTVIGDASGNAAKSSSDTTDWDIIVTAMRGMRNAIIKRGLIVRSDIKTGTNTYSNPSVQGSITILNYYLRDAEGRVMICFLPESKEKNNGVAGALSQLQLDADGNVDKRVDRDTTKDSDGPVTHWLDNVRYLVVHHNGSDQLVPDGKSFANKVESLSSGSSFGGSTTFTGAFG